ncbi:MAG: hypothetical protein WBN65_06780 [Gammaproteobacteria bacterium]
MSNGTTSNPWVRFARTAHRHPDWLRVYVEGDSWFAFPGLFNRTSIPGWLVKLMGAKFAVYRVDAAGDTAADMLSGRQRRRLRDRLKNDNADFQLLLFSGGGNDVIDDLDAIVRNAPGGIDASAYIDFAALRATVDRVVGYHIELADLRDRYRRKCQIVTHTYDIPFPDGRKVKKLGIRKGPWIKPALKDVPKKFHRGVIRIVMDQFADGLVSAGAGLRRFTVVDTRGTLVKQKFWGDEIHPTSRGFEKIAEKIRDELHRQFPNHI